MIIPVIKYNGFFFIINYYIISTEKHELYFFRDKYILLKIKTRESSQEKTHYHKKFCLTKMLPKS